MNWLGYVKGCAFGACLVAASCLGAELIALNPPVAMGVVFGCVIVFFGVMWGKYGAPWE